MINQRGIGKLLFIGVFSICLLLNAQLTHADCVSDWIAKNPAKGSITPQELSDIKCIFDWFETSFPQVFYPKSNSTNSGSLAYRAYTGNSAFLVAWKTTSLKIVYLGPLSANCVMELGTVDFWKKLVCNTPAGITPGLWTGSNIQLFVSSDSDKITSTGSSIQYNGKTYAFALGPITYSNVGTCGNVKLTIYLSGDIPIDGNAFTAKTSDSSVTIEGDFTSGILSNGTYSVNMAISTSSCSGYAKGTGSWSATPIDLNSSSKSDGQSNRHEIATENMVIVIEND